MVAALRAPGPVINLPGCTVSIEPDWLFERMATHGQGWHIRNERGERCPLLSPLDLAVLDAIRSCAWQRGRLVVGVPRVVVGIVLAPVIYVALRALIQIARPGEAGAQGVFPIRSGQHILVASRSHEIRDLLAESVITFEGTSTRLIQFPMYRLTRDGTLVPAKFGRLPKALPPLATIHHAPRIVVYDYWPLPPGIQLSNVAAVFAEMAEHDDVDVVERMKEIIDRMGAGFAMAIININDVAKRERLSELGFEFMAAQTAAERREEELSPTFTGVDLVAPKIHRIRFHCLPDDTPVAEPLTEAFQLLAEVHARLSPEDVYPRPLNRAWYLLDQLTSCPSSLQRYEQLRRQNAYSCSLRFMIKGLEQVNWNLVPNSVRGSLLARWRQVIDLLTRAYDLLLQSNPKWWALAEVILYAEAPMAVILSNRLAAQALREELLIEFDWSDVQSPVSIRALSEARRNDERFDRLVVLGSWNDRQRGVLFSLLPCDILVLGYPFEGPVLEKRLRAIQADLDVTIATATCTTLARLLGKRVHPIGERNGSAIRWNSEELLTARHLAQQHWKRVPASDASDTAAEDELLFDQVATRTATGPPWAEETGDEPKETVTLTFTDGLELVVSAVRELVVLPVGGRATEQRFPSDLRPGDRVLLLSAGEQADLFSTALARTSHLIPSDPRILSRWREALVTLRHQYPPSVRGTSARLIDALRRLGCSRDDVTIRGWLRGSTMAPREQTDIAYVLRLAGGFTDVDRWAALVDREVNIMRDFHRRIGRRIARRLALPEEERRPTDRIDQEIDELLEQTNLRTVLRVGPVETRPKLTISPAAIKEDDL